MKRRYLVLGVIGLMGCTPEEISCAVAVDQARRSELTNDHAAEWERIAWCESGRQWSLRATNRTGTYGGGLMIRDNVWREYGGREFAQTADQASKEQQIEIAERILDDVGWKAWDCA